MVARHSPYGVGPLHLERGAWLAAQLIVSGGDVDTTAIGQDEFRALAEQSAFLFSSRKQTPTKFQTEGEVVSVDIDFAGTLATDIPDGMKAGEELRVTGRSEYIFRDEKIHRLTDYS